MFCLACSRVLDWVPITPLGGFVELDAGGLLAEELPSLQWFVGKNSGRLASRTPEAMAQAVIEELRLWNHRPRQPQTIASTWGAKLHSDRVAARILALLAVGPL